MIRQWLARALAGACAIPLGALAQDAVVVTGSPLGSALFDRAPPGDVLEGRSLVFRRRGSLGDTLDGQPGISASSFGPGASRPVIRGLDGDRIRILQNGADTHDASALSFDHAVPYDPLVAERIEVVRGPAAVLYGGSAIGGVVNAIDNRIPQSPIDGASGRAEPRFGGADRERSLGALVEGGNGRVALHADGFSRASGDLRTPRSTLANSNGRSDGGALGAAATWDSGYLGLSHGVFASNYGSIPEPSVRIDMQSTRSDIAGEVRDLQGPVSALRFKGGRTGYEHRELDDGSVGTTFRNAGRDGRLELTQRKAGPLQGVLGASFSNSDFSALGAEAFVPATRTRSHGVFAYEELGLDPWKLSAGARRDTVAVSSDAEGRSFQPTSGALGAVYRVDKAWAIAANASATQRAPTYYELFANGPHVATGAWEVGNPTFGVERSRSLDLGVRWRNGPHSASASVYETRFANFLTLAASGNSRTTAAGDVLPELVYRALPATFRGFEAQARVRLHETPGALDLVVKSDYVKAIERDTGQPLPRIPPLRLSAGLEYARNAWSGGVELQGARAQRNVSANELPTSGYMLANASLAYTFKLETTAVQAFLRMNNLFDQEARNHVSFLKDVAPMPGRGVLAGMRASF